ncbi:MAG TPA: creatininase family protein [Candidatus Limnocylindrales bacterium]|nr:creatininase family protein [Candidatus Limnocylindrales bacterium]
MKPPTVFLGEMTNLELEAFLAEHGTVVVPVGSTEQHGPHGPLLTDVLVPQEIARRIASRVGAVVAPPVNYGLSYPHVGFTGVVHLRIPTFMALIEDLCASFAAIGFTRIVFLNGHYDNTYAIAYACAAAAAAGRMPAGVRAFPVNYWDGMTADEVAEFFGPTTGLHANRGETSAVLAIDPALVDMDRANAEMPPFPEVSSPAPVHTAFFFSAPGSVHRATHSGTWGDARESSPEYGERYLAVVTEATVRMLDDIERTFAAMPPR